MRATASRYAAGQIAQADASARRAGAARSALSSSASGPSKTSSRTCVASSGRRAVGESNLDGACESSVGLVGEQQRAAASSRRSARPGGGSARPTRGRARRPQGPARPTARRAASSVAKAGRKPGSRSATRSHSRAVALGQRPGRRDATRAARGPCRSRAAVRRAADRDRRDRRRAASPNDVEAVTLVGRVHLVEEGELRPRSATSAAAAAQRPIDATEEVAPETAHLRRPPARHPNRPGTRKSMIRKAMLPMIAAPTTIEHQDEQEAVLLELAQRVGGARVDQAEQHAPAVERRDGQQVEDHQEDVDQRRRTRRRSARMRPPLRPTRSRSAGRVHDDQAQRHGHDARP